MKTATEAYGEPDDEVGRHWICDICHLCITCEDCKCDKDVRR